MNKLTKASIAGGAAILLLMGGAGTLASWNATANAGAASTITAGTLTITSNEDGVWTSDGAPVDLSTFRAVPGDVLEYTTTFNVVAVGDNLTATAALASGAITAASSDANDVALANRLSTSAAFTINGIPGTTVTASTAVQTVEVVVTLTWPDGTIAEDNPAKDGIANLSDFAVTLTQN